MNWEVIGRIVVFLAFAHALVAFAWAFYWQLKLESALLYERAVHVASGTGSLEATGLAQTALVSDARMPDCGIGGVARLFGLCARSLWSLPRSPGLHRMASTDGDMKTWSMYDMT